MLLPNKIFSYNESVLSKFSPLLTELANSPQSVANLYWLIRQQVPDVSEYIEILACLYALRRIEYDEAQGVLKYVG